MMAGAFASWAADALRGRPELVWGTVVNRPPPRSNHALLRLHVARRLADAFNAAGLAADIYTDGLTVPINDIQVYAPDVIVRTGPRLAADATSCEDPEIVVEIVPAGEKRVETQERVDLYFRRPSLQHLLIMRVDDPVILHHVRSKDDVVWAHMVRDGVLRLDPPGIEAADLRLPAR